MLGWLILFALMVVLGCVEAMTGNAVATSMRVTTIVFALLFLVGLLTRAVRGRAW